jgi:hypothetical protein
MQRDLLKNAELSQGPNLYSYTKNNPVNFTDPMGLDAYGFSVSGNATAGLGGAGLSALAGKGAAYFSGTGSVETFSYSDTFAGGLDDVSEGVDAPAGLFAGGGLNAFWSNADTPCDLLKTTQSILFDIGLGAVSFSLSVSYGNGIVAVEVSGGPISPGLGIHITGATPTTTVGK